MLPIIQGSYEIFLATIPIIILGVGKNNAACHITAKGITTLITIDGTDLDVIIYYSNKYLVTTISPNAVVRDNHTLTS